MSHRGRFTLSHFESMGTVLFDSLWMALILEGEFVGLVGVNDCAVRY